MNTPGQASLNEALDRMWVRFLPQMEERLAILQTAAAELAIGSLSETQKTAAHEAAHKLAGVLGTFGLTKGTVLAREAEVIYSGEPDPALAAQLAQVNEQLRSMIEAR